MTATYQIYNQEKELLLRNHSQLINFLAYTILQEYEYYKHKKNLLDYNDLIIKACNLLNNNSAKEWVLYKLDGFINHILIDEAQDTSKAQWEIINALISEFYSGNLADNDNRSIFVVGDDKQSIFSFQGADVATFLHTNTFLEHQMLNGGKKFQNIKLEISYRSAQEILDVVHQVFSSSTLLCHFQSLVKLSAARNAISGTVELWPTICVQNNEQAFWPILRDDTNILSQTKTLYHMLACKIADYIAHVIKSERTIAATNMTVTAGDFMILVRTIN